jgi:hypothetical protein
MEAVLHLTRAELQQRLQQLSATDERTAQLAAAAQALLLDYTTDTELTSFTALDSEDFHEATSRPLWLRMCLSLGWFVCTTTRPRAVYSVY